MRMHAVAACLGFALFGTSTVQAQQRVDPAPNTPERANLALLFQSDRPILAGLPECKPRRTIVHIDSPEIGRLGRAPPAQTSITFVVDIDADGKVLHAAPEFAPYDIAFLVKPFYESLQSATFARGKVRCRQSNTISITFTD